MKDLSIIIEDNFESNHSSVDSDERKKKDQLSDSDWDSRNLGNSLKDGGYNLANVTWNDLGRKFFIKKGNKSKFADFESQSARHFHTVDVVGFDPRPDVKIQL